MVTSRQKFQPIVNFSFKKKPKKTTKQKKNQKTNEQICDGLQLPFPL